MCGIVAYVGSQKVGKALFQGLKCLEYRGYDSAGVALLQGEKIKVLRRVGQVDSIEACQKLEGSAGIGHTRWATHGGVKKENAHPHTCGQFSIVHNGIIENYLELKYELLDLGHTFSSETDSEVIVHLLCEYYEGDFITAVQKTLKRLKGSFALCILCVNAPATVVCARQKNPLILGHGRGEYYAASDLSALYLCDEIYPLCDGEIAVITAKKIGLYSFDLVEKTPVFCQNTVGENCADKAGFQHFTLKEIYEVPSAVKRTALAFDRQKAADLWSGVGAVTGAVTGTVDRLGKRRVTRVYIVGSGTAYHSGVVGGAVLERALKIPVSVELSSEFCYRKPLLDRTTLVIAVSQSGETADTLMASRLAIQKGARLAVITNVAYSTLARMTSDCFVTQAGVEVGVAATKTYAAQLAIFYAFLSVIRGKSTRFLLDFPRKIDKIWQKVDQIQALCKKLNEFTNVYFIGRGLDYGSAIEGSLKLREISYIPSAGYASGELKHGSLALMDKNTAVVAIITQTTLKEKSKNAVHEARSRGAFVVAITPFDDIPANEVIKLPRLPQKYAPLSACIPLQLIAYYTAVARGHNPDKPRNLAKSVTVE